MTTLLLYLVILFGGGLHVPDMTHRWPMIAVARAAQVVQNPSEPDEFPDGMYCSPKGNIYKGLQTPDSPCACHLVMRQDADGCCNVPQNNDPKCTQYCHEHHCSCPRECLDSSK